MRIVCNVSAKGNKTGNNSKMHSQVEGLGYHSKQDVNDWNVFKCDRGSIFHVYILNSHLALFQPSEIR